tara:strand:+ start:173 stop:409 length:237 start_codon:yes stop_codon:yes gene_type:complete
MVAGTPSLIGGLSFTELAEETAQSSEVFPRRLLETSGFVNGYQKLEYLERNPLILQHSAEGSASIRPTRSTSPAWPSP